MIALDRQAIAVWLDRPERTIREHCRIVGYDRQGRALYDAEACAETLEHVPTRRRDAVDA